MITAYLAYDQYLRDWDRTLRAANHPDTTRYNYLLAVVQLARYLGEQEDTAGAADDPTVVDRAAVEEFQAWMVQARSAATALNKHKGLQQFFKWLAEDEEIARSPMERVRQPKTPTKLIPIIRDDDTKRVLGACKGTQFVNLRERNDPGVLLLYMRTLGQLTALARSGDAPRSPSPVVHAAAAIGLLLVALVLSVYKPRGRTPWEISARR